MTNNMRIETWNGYSIRFVEKDGEWWAILKDICDALDLKTFKVSQRLETSMMTRIRVEVCDIPSKDTTSKARNTQDMLAVNELGIYETLFASKKLEARKFRQWTATVMKKLRKAVGLQGYEVMVMTDPMVQEQINDILDTLYWDEEKKCVMRSVTVQGGDVEQIPFEEC